MTKWKLSFNSPDFQPSAFSAKPHILFACVIHLWRGMHGLSPPGALLVEEMGSPNLRLLFAVDQKESSLTSCCAFKVWLQNKSHSFVNISDSIPFQSRAWGYVFRELSWTLNQKLQLVWEGLWGSSVFFFPREVYLTFNIEDFLPRYLLCTKHLWQVSMWAKKFIFYPRGRLLTAQG